MSEENPTCPICGGLHPAGHRDKELEEKLRAIKEWIDENYPRPYLRHGNHYHYSDVNYLIEGVKRILESSPLGENHE